MAANRWEMLAKRVAVMHQLWNAAVADLTLDQVNHHERGGVLPIVFSLFHYVQGEDRTISERLLGEPLRWTTGDWAGKTGIEADAIKRGTPIAVAEQVRLVDLNAWRGYQSAVFTRTEAALGGLADGRWDEVLFAETPDHVRGGFLGHLAGDGPVLLGDLIEVFVYQHGMRHLGEIEHARSLVGLQGVS
jgi:hypothetical protein